MAQRIGEAVVKVLRFLGAEGVLELIPVRRAAKKVLESYPKARFVHYSRGILYVWSDDPATRFKLQTSNRRIAKAVNSLLGRSVVKRVILRKNPPSTEL